MLWLELDGGIGLGGFVKLPDEEQSRLLGFWRARNLAPPKVKKTKRKRARDAVAAAKRGH